MGHFIAHGDCYDKWNMQLSSSRWLLLTIIFFTTTLPMGDTIIMRMVFVVATHYFSLDITTGTCFCQLLSVLTRLYRWDVLLLSACCLLLSLITFTKT